MFNVWGALSAFAIMGAAYWRMKHRIISEGGQVSRFSKEQIERILNDFENTDNISSVKAFIPFIVLLVFAATGIPIFVVCFVAALLTIALSRRPMMQSEADMVEGVKMLSVPFTAIIIFLFLSGVINNVGVIETVYPKPSNLPSAQSRAFSRSASCRISPAGQSGAQRYFRFQQRRLFRLFALV